MPSINLLSKDISELISAGEVIERPASVIKELVENSIDAGAKHITVEIKNGGTAFMRVTDDGCGMSFEDVPKAFLRHATSKITSKSDLDNIHTLGFRGEALASVSAVSKVELLTKQNGETYGTLYNIDGGCETVYDKGGCPDGTTFIIRDLFYNVPARKKFMKKDVTEGNAISNILQKITLSNPSVAIKFIRDNRTEFNSSGDGQLFSAVHAVYGRELANDMMWAEYENDGVKVSGYTIRPLYAKSNRSFQNFFVNGRYIHSKLCSSALENAYLNMLMTGKFPVCVLMIELSPSAMDVNIHPAKAEVRFTDEKSVSDAIYFAVKNAFVSNSLLYDFKLNKTPETDGTKKDTPKEAPVKSKPAREVPDEPFFTPVDQIEAVERKLYSNEPVSEQYSSFNETADITGCTEYLNDKISEEKKRAKPLKKVPAPPNSNKSQLQETEEVQESPLEEITENIQGFRYINNSSFEKHEQIIEEPSEKESIKVIGELFGLYIVAETSENTVIIIDKHASHERIIFEKLKERNCRQYMQKLLYGVKILLTEKDCGALEENTELLADMGFEFDFSQKPCVTATAVPTFIMELDMENVICEIAENLRLHKQNPQSHSLDDILHTVACKSAIRGNDKNSVQELQSLAEQVYFNKNIRHCPHGRPVMFTITKNNIAHQFKRT